MKKISVVITSFLMAINVLAQKDAVLRIVHIDKEIDLASLNDPQWKKAGEVRIDRYWSGKPAPSGRGFRARLLWSNTAIYVRFEMDQTEPLVVSAHPDTANKTVGLWERDVGEIFIAPDRASPNKYFEFEVAPSGEWIDLRIEVTQKERLTDLEYRSGMTAAARIETGKVLMGMKIPFTAFRKTPKAGDVWLGNIFRCVGLDPNRGYLAWRPTLTKTPNFHVPESFGRLIFDN